MFLLLIFLMTVGVLLFLMGNASWASAMVGGVITGFIVWLVCGAFWLLGQAYDGCNSLDADDMCVDTSFGEIRG